MASAMPPGWEAKVTKDGRTYYVDHNTKKTSWKQPVMAAPAAAPAASPLERMAAAGFAPQSAAAGYARPAAPVQQAAPMQVEAPPPPPPPANKKMPNFIPSTHFAGAHPGFDFKTGLLGLGYYKYTPPPRDAVMRLRGLHPDTTPQKIVEFLGITSEPLLEVSRVHMIKDVTGNHGECCVELIGEAQAEAAADMDREDLLGNFIEVLESTRAEMISLIKLGTTFDTVVRMRGLKKNSNLKHILRFFDGQPVRKETVVLLSSKDSAEAFVEFEGGEDVIEDAMDKDRDSLQGNFIELFKTTKGVMARAMHDFEVAKAAAAVEAQRLQDESFENSVMRMRGLEFSATKKDIIGFLDGFTVNEGEDGVHIIMGPDRRPSGEGYVEMESVAEVARCVGLLHRCTFVNGRRYVELFPSSRSELARTLGKELPQKKKGPAPGSFMKSIPREGDAYDAHMEAVMEFATAISDAAKEKEIRERPYLKIRGIPFKSTEEDIEEFFTGYGYVPGSVILGVDPDGRSSGEAWIYFGSQSECQRALHDRNREYMGGRYVELYCK